MQYVEYEPNPMVSERKNEELERSHLDFYFANHKNNTTENYQIYGRPVSDELVKAIQRYVSLIDDEEVSDEVIVTLFEIFREVQ